MYSELGLNSSDLFSRVVGVRWGGSVEGGVVQNSSVQFKMVSMRSEKPICAPPCLAEVFSELHGVHLVLNVISVRYVSTAFA